MVVKARAGGVASFKPKSGNIVTPWWYRACHLWSVYRTGGLQILASGGIPLNKVNSHLNMSAGPLFNYFPSHPFLAILSMPKSDDIDLDRSSQVWRLNPPPLLRSLQAFTTSQYHNIIQPLSLVPFLVEVSNVSLFKNLTIPKGILQLKLKKWNLRNVLLSL